MAQSNTNRLFFHRNLTLGHLLTWRPILGLLVIAAAITGYFFMPPLFAGVDQTEENLSPQRVFVRTFQLKSQSDFAVPIWYTGQVNARRKTAVGFQRSGKVTKINFDEGDFVRVNEPIASLDNRQLNARIKQLNSEMLAAKARHQELKNGPRNQAKLSAEANVLDLEEQAKNARLDLDRVKRLFRQGAVSEQERDQAKYRVTTLEARIDAADAQLDEINDGTRIEKVNAAKAILDGTQAANELAEYDLDDCTLRAPFSGTITRRMVDDGAVLDTGQPVVELVESQHLEFRVGLPVELVRTLSPNSKLTVAFGEETFEAHLKSKLLALDPSTQTQTIILKLSDKATSKGVVDGQMGRVKFENVTHERGFLIPTTAIVNDQQGLWNCYTLEQKGDREIAKRQVVHVLHFQGDDAFVSGTLIDGQSIVADGLQRLANGQVVERVKSTRGSE